MKTIYDYLWIYSYEFYSWNKFLAYATMFFDLEVMPLQIKWDRTALSVHLYNHYTSSKEENQKAPDSSQSMEIFVTGAHQV